MLNRILFSPDGGVALAPAAPAAPPKPAAAPSPAPKPAAAAVVAPTPEPSDDPFEAPKRPDAATPPKPAGADLAAPPRLTDVDIDKMAPGPLRQRVKQLNAEKESFTSEKSKLESKIKEFESRGVDTSALTTRLSVIEKERDSALAELRAARQEASPEFIEKYDKPFNRAANSTKAKIEQLQVVGSEDGLVPARPATWADFTTLYGLPVGKAIEQANAMFGTSASFVISKLEQLRDLDDARANALQEEKAQFKERTAKDIADQAVKRQGVGKLWVETNQRLSQSDAYKVDQSDAELTEAAKHAEKVFDTTIEVNSEDSLKQKVLKDAHIKQKTIGYSVRGIIINRQKAEIEALKKQVDELKGTAPGSVQRPGGGADGAAAETDEDWEAAAIREVKAKGG